MLSLHGYLSEGPKFWISKILRLSCLWRVVVLDTKNSDSDSSLGDAMIYDAEKKWACFARQPNNFNIAQCILSPNSDKKVLSQPITLSLLRLRTSFWKIFFWLCWSRQTTLHFRVLGICLCRFCSLALSQALLAVQHINDKKANPGPLTPMAHGTILAYFLNSFQQKVMQRQVAVTVSISSPTSNRSVIPNPKSFQEETRETSNNPHFYQVWSGLIWNTCKIHMKTRSVTDSGRA